MRTIAGWIGTLAGVACSIVGSMGSMELFSGRRIDAVDIMGGPVLLIVGVALLVVCVRSLMRSASP